MSKINGTIVAAIATIGLLCAVPAARSAEAGATATSPGPFGTRAVDAAALSKLRGGTDLGSASDLKLNGVVSDNRASNLTTGNNVIADGALSGVSGVPLVVQNSGNNVLIQSATIINVTVK